MNTEKLVVLALAAFALVAAPSATADAVEPTEPETTGPVVIPCVLHVKEANVAGEVTVQEVKVGSC